MVNIMQKIRAEARRRREARDQKEAKLKAQAADLSDLDQQPEQRTPAASGSMASSSGDLADVAPEGGSAAADVPRLSGGSDGGTVDSTTLVESTEITMPMCGCWAVNDPIWTQLFALAGMHPPSEASFEQPFRAWFEEVYFPIMATTLHGELVSRAKSKGFFSGLSSHVQKFAMANTDVRLQAALWHAYFVQYSPPQFQTLGCIRVATVNLGSVAYPAWTLFLGYQSGHDSHWKTSPVTSFDVNVASILDELDGRGGMTALLAAA